MKFDLDAAVAIGVIVAVVYLMLQDNKTPRKKQAKAPIRLETAS